MGITLAVGVIIGKFFPAGDDSPATPTLRFRNDKITNILNIIESSYVNSVNRKGRRTLN